MTNAIWTPDQEFIIDPAFYLYGFADEEDDLPLYGFGDDEDPYLCGSDESDEEDYLFGFPEVYLFEGEEYVAVYAFGRKKKGLFRSIGKFASNAVKTAGRAVGTVTKPIQSAVGAVTKTVGKIPVVGGPLKTVLGSGYSSAMAPIKATTAIAKGKRIDRVAVGTLKNEVKNFKQVAPYAAMVVSVVPGIGTGISAGLSAGLALAEGQSIVNVLKAGAVGALPGGPLVKAAVTMGVETIQRAATGQRVDLKSLSQTAAGVAGSALGLPIAARNALMAGVAVTGNIVSGKPLDKALADGAIKGLPISDTAKRAMTEASAISLDLAHGKRVDAALTSRMNRIIAALPPNNPLRDTLKTTLTAVQKAGGKDAERILHTALNSGLADSLVSMGAKPLPVDVQKSIKTGIALGSGIVIQNARKAGIGAATGKLTQSGIELAKTSPMFAEARKMAVANGTVKGFDLATGLLQQRIGVFDLATARNSLDAKQKLGFDMATSLRIGAVSNPKPATISPAAAAGFAITKGMQTYVPERKAVIMQTVQKSPSATVGAIVAVKEVANTRESWFARLLKALGIRK